MFLLPIKLLRYNTGNDKYAFLQFKDKFSAVIFNANIVVHSTSAIADIVSVHKKHYIIDPQTHIFQHPIKALQTTVKKDGNRTTKIKQSVQNYLELMPPSLKDKVMDNKKQIEFSDIIKYKNELVDCVYNFQVSYINNSMETKEYNKYLEFADINPKPRLLIAPYFMLKKEYSIKNCENWLAVNKECLKDFINKSDGHSVAAQLVISKDKLINKNILDRIRETYNINGYSYIFIWIDEFASWDATNVERESFKDLLDIFSTLKKKPIMAYGGYDSILLCHKESKHPIYGVAQSVGYGESRSITPVGGGFPVNKYYLLPLHQRMVYGEVANILTSLGYFDDAISLKERTKKYYKNICNCDKCHEIIEEDINNFSAYNESSPFTIKTKNGEYTRNRPTTNASRIAAIHYMHCKVTEWKNLDSNSLDYLMKKLQNDYKNYSPREAKIISNWCKLYG